MMTDRPYHFDFTTACCVYFFMSTLGEWSNSLLAAYKMLEEEAQSLQHGPCVLTTTGVPGYSRLFFAHKKPKRLQAKSDHIHNSVLPSVYVCPSKKPDYMRNPTIFEPTITRDYCVAC
jgi:hypothetical protein